MSLDATIVAISDRLIANWTEFPVAQIVFDNESLAPQGFDEWARSSVVETNRAQQTLGRVGNRKFQSNGSHFLQMYVLPNIGSKRGSVLVDHFRSIFEAVTFSDILFHQVLLRSRIPNGDYIQVTAEALFSYHETK